jgi:hypothetical protein
VPVRMAQRDAIQPGSEQPVMVRSRTILSHSARIEHADDKSKLALTVPGSQALGTQGASPVAVPLAWPAAPSARPARSAPSRRCRRLRPRPVSLRPYRLCTQFQHRFGQRGGGRLASTRRRKCQHPALPSLLWTSG